MWKLFRHRQPGISLVEVLIVIGIAGILLAMATPSFLGMTQRFRAAAAANAFVGDLRFARSEALKRGMPVIVCASSNGTTCADSTEWNIGWLIFPAPAETGDAPPPLRRQLAWTSRDTFGTDSNAGAIRFNRDGFIEAMPTSGIATFTLRTEPANESATQCVTLSRTGRARAHPARAGNCA